VGPRLQRGETVVVVERSGSPLGAIAITAPVRPEAAESLRSLHAMDIRTAILSGDGQAAVSTVGAELGIDEARGALDPQAKLGAIRALSASGRGVVMVGDGVNDAPALAAADVGCAIGSGSEVAIAHSDVTLVGSDLRGVPAAVSVARSTFRVMLQNFGWAAGYNLAALPLAAFGLIDPLVAAAAMAVSSLLVVANSLRLRRLGRSGLASEARVPRLGGARAVILAVALPIVLFVALTLASEAFSPARGESLLPEFPSVTTVQVGQEGTADVYANPGVSGFNELHLYFYPPTADTAISGVRVSAGRAGSVPQLLRQLRVASNHYIDYVLLSPGRWVFRVDARVGGHLESFDVQRSIP